jgi:hypothetical protein
MLKRVLRKCVIVSAALAALWFGAALVFWPAPKFAHPLADVTANSTQVVTPANPDAEAGTERFRMRETRCSSTFRRSIPFTPTPSGPWSA